MSQDETPKDQPSTPPNPRFPTLESLIGAAGKLKTPMSWDEMMAAVDEDRAREWKARLNL